MPLITGSTSVKNACAQKFCGDSRWNDTSASFRTSPKMVHSFDARERRASRKIKFRDSFLPEIYVARKFSARTTRLALFCPRPLGKNSRSKSALLFHSLLTLRGNGKCKRGRRKLWFPRRIKKRGRTEVTSQFAVRAVVV